MRKLSKKISMLMVLAMLVSLFSGIVSASAASAWSFKSSKYDVAVGETIEMEKNEYADFDLFKNDAAPAGYTVKWESSNPDAVWVNAKTGQLRADKFKTADYGDKATISATFTNTATKKSATRSFVIVVAEDAEYAIVADFGDEAFVVGEKYALAAKVTADGKDVAAEVAFTVDGVAVTEFAPAEAGEVTIVVTASVDGKEVAKKDVKVVVVDGGLKAAKQITMNTVALTFGSAEVAKAVAADPSKIGSVYYFVTNVNEIQAFVKEVAVDEKDATVVNVTLYNDITKDTTYKFTYAGKSCTIKGVDRDQIASMSIKTVEVPMGSANIVKVNLYNADGILVKTDVINGFGLQAMSSGEYTVPHNGNTIQFHAAGKSATVKATYWMGYDENGVKIPDLEAVGVITSYDPAARSMSQITGWSTNGGASYDTNNNMSLAFGENGQLMFKFDVTDHNGNVTTQKYEGGNAWLTGYGYAVGFESSNPNVVLIDETSTLGYYYPVGAGTAQIIVHRYPTARNWEKEVIGVFNVTVVAKRNLTSLAPTLNGTKLSSAVDASLKLMPNAKDQTGAFIDGAADVALYVKLATQAPAGITLKVNGSTVPFVTNGDGILITTQKDWPGDTPYVVLTADNNVDYQERLVHAIVTAKQVNGATLSSQVIAIRTKAPQQAVSYALDGVADSFDMNILADRYNDNYDRFKTEVKLSAYDAAGYLVDVKDAAGTDLLVNAAAAATGTFYYTFQKDYSDVTLTNNVFRAVTKLNSGELDKVDAGNYVVTAWMSTGDALHPQYLTSKTIVVTDSTPAMVALKLDNKLYGVTDPAQVQGALVLDRKIGFTRNGERLWSDISIVDVKSEVYVNANRVNVQTVTVRESYAGGAYIDYEVPVYMTYETN